MEGGEIKIQYHFALCMYNTIIVGKLCPLQETVGYDPEMNKHNSLYFAEKGFCVSIAE